MSRALIIFASSNKCHTTNARIMPLLIKVPPVCTVVDSCSVIFPSVDSSTLVLTHHRATVIGATFPYYTSIICRHKLARVVESAMGGN